MLDGDIAAAFFDALLIHAETERLLSDDHFTVDTLLEAWASHKSFRPRDEEPPSDGGSNPTVNFHQQRRTNATHRSTTDPDARLYKKAQGREARLGYLGHLLMEHRSGLIVRTAVTPADGHGERDAALYDTGLSFWVHSSGSYEPASGGLPEVRGPSVPFPTAASPSLAEPRAPVHLPISVLNVEASGLQSQRYGSIRGDLLLTLRFEIENIVLRPEVDWRLNFASQEPAWQTGELFNVVSRVR